MRRRRSSLPDAPVLRTDRLVLRPWRTSAREPFAALNADPEVTEFFPSLLPRDVSDAFADRIEAAMERDGWGLWAVEVVDGDPFVGFVGMAMPGFDAPFKPCVEIGWRLARSAWGHGYAAEAAREALRFAFDDLAFTEVQSWTAVGNVRSQAVMRRIGMTHDPVDDFDHPALPEGHPLRPHVRYRIRPAAPT